MRAGRAHRKLLIAALAATVLAVVSFGALLAVAASGGGDSTNDDVPIPGDRGHVEICVDSVPGAMDRGAAADAVRAAIEDSRLSRPEIWVSIYEETPAVVGGCPIGAISFDPAEATRLEHGVDVVSEPILFVFVQAQGTDVPNGAQSVPYEVYPAVGNGIEATSILFLAHETAEEPGRMRDAIEKALGLGYEPAPPPAPGATK